MKYILTSYSSESSKNKSGSIRELSPNQYNPLDEQLILKNPNIRIICDCCLKNVTIVCHIASEDYDYCVGCFSQLDEFPQTYTVRSTMLYSLTEPQWMCLDQILLLTAFQKWGFGNWGEVKDYMNFNGSQFNKIQIQQHYDKYYLDTENLYPKIDCQIVEGTKSNSARQAKRFKIHLQKKNQRKPIVQLKSQQMLAIPKKSPLNQGNVLGYNPKRKCFYYDLQYDEKAQTMLADLQFLETDTEEQMELKFKIIQNYNCRLDERLKRYKFTIDHHILDIDYRFRQQFSANKYQKQAFQVYRPFTRFLTHEKNQEAMELIAEGNHCKSLIQGLKMCRKKIDKQGKIQATLQYLNSKQDNVEKWGNPRKIYHIEVEDPYQTVSQETLRRFQSAIQRIDESGTIHNLKVIYKSSNA